MSNDEHTRDLSDLERSGYNLVKTFEDAVRAKNLTVTLSASASAAVIITSDKHSRGRYKLLKVKWKSTEQKYDITFTLNEFRRYITYILPLCGLTLNIDGSFTTSDRLTISNSYLGDET